MTGASAIATVNPFMHASPMVSGSDSSGSASSQSATISANDFLTLLVTEMKNQDPTAQTDPNEYINQLVQVNSLEQLIQINQNLSTALGTPSGSATGQISNRPTDAGNSPDRMATNGTGLSGRDSRNLLTVGSGNLGIPQSVPAALRVAKSLSGQN